MDPELARQICSKGGKASHAKGVAHKWTKETARIAGRKGGLASGKSRSTKDKPIPYIVANLDDKPLCKCGVPVCDGPPCDDPGPEVVR